MYYINPVVIIIYPVYRPKVDDPEENGYIYTLDGMQPFVYRRLVFKVFNKCLNRAFTDKGITIFN